MFSKRIADPDASNPVSRRWEERRVAGLPLVDLVAQNPTRAGLEYPRAAILAALRREEALCYDPNPLGLPEAREALARDWGERGFRVLPDEIVLTASTSEAYALLFKLLCDPGEQVLVPQPSYPLFEVLAGLEGVEARGYRLAYDGAWSIDLDSVRASMSPRTRAIIAVSPNNPTGSFLKRDELEGLASLGVPMIVDEVFSPYGFAPDARRAKSVLECTSGLCFALDGLSKRAALPQLKLGWITVGGEAKLKRAALERLEVVNDSYLSASTPVMHALAELLEVTAGVRASIRARLQGNLRSLARLTRGSAVSALHVEGGWYACLELPDTRPEEEWILELADRGLRVHPGWFYDFTRGAHSVVSLLVEPTAFESAISELVETVEAGV